MEIKQQIKEQKGGGRRTESAFRNFDDADCKRPLNYIIIVQWSSSSSIFRHFSDERFRELATPRSPPRLDGPRVGLSANGPGCRWDVVGSGVSSD